MNEYIAYCGLDCEACEARLATINNDNELRIKVSKEWSELNGVEITPEMISCSGRISFLIAENAWYNDHNLFQIVLSNCFDNSARSNCPIPIIIMSHIPIYNI